MTPGCALHDDARPGTRRDSPPLADLRTPAHLSAFPRGVAAPAASAFSGRMSTRRSPCSVARRLQLETVAHAPQGGPACPKHAPDGTRHARARCPRPRARSSWPPLSVAADDESGSCGASPPLAALAGRPRPRARVPAARRRRALRARRAAPRSVRLDAREAERFPQAAIRTRLDEALDALTDDDLESAAPELTARVRGARAAAVAGCDPVVDLFLAGGTARLGGRGHSVPTVGRNALGLDALRSPRPCARSDVRSRCSSPTPGSVARRHDRKLALLDGLARVAGVAIERARLDGRAHRALGAARDARGARQERDRADEPAHRAGAGRARRHAGAVVSRRGAVAHVGRRPNGARGSCSRRCTSATIASIPCARPRRSSRSRARVLNAPRGARGRRRGRRSAPRPGRRARRGRASTSPPLLTPAGTLGVLGFYGPAPRSLSEPAVFDAEDARVAEAMIAQAAAVLAQALLSDRVREAETRLRRAGEARGLERAPRRARRDRRRARPRRRSIRWPRSAASRGACTAALARTTTRTASTSRSSCASPSASSACSPSTSSSRACRARGSRSRA